MKKNTHESLPSKSRPHDLEFLTNNKPLLYAIIVLAIRGAIALGGDIVNIKYEVLSQLDPDRATEVVPTPDPTPDNFDLY